MSDFTVDVNGFKLPSGTKLVRLALTLADGGMSYAVILEPANAIAVGKLLQRAGEAGQRLIELPEQNVPGFKVTSDT